jgi:V/A-type H+-transporting ATPase subunit E
MDIQLQELLDKIKREGVEAAEQSAASIRAEAEKRRNAIIAEASSIVENARSEAAKAEESGRAAVAQASRDLVLAFRDRIEAVLAAVVSADTAAAYGSAALEKAIPEVVKALAATASDAGGSDELVLLLEPSMLKELEGRFAARLSAELKKGLVLKPFPDIKAGFRVAEKDGSAYYDFSAEAVAELFARHLNARLAATVKAAIAGM